jgi:hypothetical protein
VGYPDLVIPDQFKREKSNEPEGREFTQERRRKT